MAAVITATAVLTIGGVTFTLTRSGTADASDGLSVQANVNVNQLIAELPKLGFAGSVPENAASDSSQNCSQNSTGDVKAFLAQNQCKEYAITLVQLHRQGIATQAAISWVVMTTPSLTREYKNLVDARYKGNPPGQSANFDGLCYASGQNGDTTWVAQVQPTGHANIDGQILQAVSPANLSASYLAMHCIA